ncbi:VOC family protein [Halalkalibacter hemicellulosilyticus]|uniref:VOC domain-containing protein n=1 Tax=Halalkalibacter hemicellulosilyticusJCM 9152 TaxID=1236971 RepID=W4QLM1_9BACI|nr:VOC family protein [Halalkalibacter hemicellulosilyticus]GAE32976.1 hypothetical protein JCM9152_4575 [Halalkalibacter hemicellulosilyticusJCM 9152]
MSDVKAKPFLKKVHCNYIPVSNVEKAVEWYERCLQLKRVSPEGGIMELGNGDWLFLIEAKQKVNANFLTDNWDGEGFEMFSLTFEVEDSQALYEQLLTEKVEVEPVTNQGKCGLQFTFIDLDGNKFNVWEDVQ